MTPVSLKHRVEYFAFRAAAAELLTLPPKAAFRAAEAVGALAFHVLRRRTQIGRENIAAAFPGFSGAEVELLLARAYRSLFRLAAEVIYFRRILNRHNWRQYVDVVNWRRMLAVFLEGRGGILVSGHVGNWEILPKVLSFIGVPNNVLIRPLDNPLLERYTLGTREAGFQSIVLKRGAGAQLEETLAGGGFISLLVDQDAGGKGAFVPFLGRAASTWRSPALLSMKTGAPVVPACCVRVEGSAKFRVYVGEPVYPCDSADVSAETLRITEAFTGTLERWVRAYPDQYLWLHRRWKSQPRPRSLVSKSIEPEDA